MAKQKGIIKLEGAIDDITFTKTSEGFKAGYKGGVSAERIATDPVFQRVRETGYEFSRAAKGGKLIRKAIPTLLDGAKDKTSTSRMLKVMMKVIKEDTTNNRGDRTITDGEVGFLQGFNFNAGNEMSSVFFTPYTTSVNRTTGTLSVSIPSFIPKINVKAPAGATHFKIVSAGIEADFNAHTSVTDLNDSGMLPLDNTATSVISISNAVTANSTHPLFLLLGIRFYEEVTGVHYPLFSKAYNTLEIVKVSAE